jgi:hypothetical protein
MPPRYAYWTILIDSKPTAFRAREQEELLPTLTQLRRTNKDVVLRWFARGKLWDSPEQAQWGAEHLAPTREKRGGDWRPGGAHKDPRARFAKGASRPREQRAPDSFRKPDPEFRKPDPEKTEAPRPFTPSGKPAGAQRPARFDRPRPPLGAGRPDRPKWTPRDDRAREQRPRPPARFDSSRPTGRPTTPRPPGPTDGSKPPGRPPERPRSYRDSSRRTDKPPRRK